MHSISHWPSMRFLFVFLVGGAELVGLLCLGLTCNRCWVLPRAFGRTDVNSVKSKDVVHMRNLVAAKLIFLQRRVLMLKFCRSGHSTSLTEW